VETRIWRYFDPILFLSMIFLVVYGIAMVYSATYERTGVGIDPLVYRHVMYVGIGLTLFVAFTGVDYHVLGNIVWLAYVGCCSLLVTVLVIGRITHGAQRWIPLGTWQFQPSEIAKVCVILALAKFLAQNVDQLRSVRVILVSMLIPAIPAVLIVLQPDVGTATVFLAIWLVVAFAAGIPLVVFGSIFGATAAVAPVAWLVMQQYQRQRIITFLNPQSDPLDAGYNAIQALISVGAGQLLGRGYLSGSQSQLHFLRVQYADFIFSVLAEELGFVGATAMLILFGLVLARGLRSAYISREAFGRLIACGIVGTLVYQVVVNVGMNEGLMPVTGVPLPMVSYGGTSLVTFMGSLGILESIVMRHRKFGF
jgi:rod shape determining protein RodA